MPVGLGDGATGCLDFCNLPLGADAVDNVQGLIT